MDDRVDGNDEDNEAAEDDSAFPTISLKSSGDMRDCNSTGAIALRSDTTPSTSGANSGRKVRTSSPT
eukprot:4448011-Amphidinium_carterae.1